MKQEHKYDALVVLGEVMEWDSRWKKWEFTAIIERYPGRLVMGRFRAWAAKIVSPQVPIILVTGGSDIHPVTGEKCSRSAELARVINEYGVKKEKIIPIGTSGASHTFGNVENVIQYLEAHPDILEQKKVAILSPRFQVTRAKMMFEMNPYFREHGIHLDWLIVEDKIISKNACMVEYFDWLYSTPQAKTCRKMEQKGIDDLNRGAYQPKT